MAAEAFSPADFDDAQLSTALGATALAQATRFAQQQPTVRVQAWQAADAPPLARLPMCTVRFFSRHNLQLARCDCVAGCVDTKLSSCIVAPTHNSDSHSYCTHMR